MAEYTLYCFAQSGSAYRVALMLSLTGADWEPRLVDFFNGETLTPEFRALNPMGEVPVLVCGARVLSQSGVILTWLAERTGTFGPQSADERLEVLRWLLFDNHKFSSSIATLRNMLSIARTGETPLTEFLRARATKTLAIVEAHLANRSFIIGERPTIADLSLCGYLYWPDEFGMTWTDYPAIARWLERIAALPGWQAPYDLMPGHPLPAKG